MDVPISLLPPCSVEGAMIHKGTPETPALVTQGEQSNARTFKVSYFNDDLFFCSASVTYLLICFELLTQKISKRARFE